MNEELKRVVLTLVEEVVDRECGRCETISRCAGPVDCFCTQTDGIKAARVLFEKDVVDLLNSKR